MVPAMERFTGKDVSDPTHCNNPRLSVPRYNSQGKYLGSLPDLGTARYEHACTTFVSSDGEEVGVSIHKLTFVFIRPRSPGPIYVSGSLSQTKRPSVNLTDVTLADEDTNSILTDKVNRAIQCNVAMQVAPSGDQIWN